MTEGPQLPAGQVPGDWKVLSLKDVTSKIGSGSTPRGGASVYVETGTSFIRSQNVLDHGFSLDGLVRISEEAAHSLRGVEVLKGDVLINITGDSILRTCIVPDEVLPARVSQHVAILRSNGLIEPQVLQKWLSVEVMKDFMLGHSSGGTRKAVTKGDLERFPLPVPPLAEQREIAGVLGALDDKIESNRRIVRDALALLSLEIQLVESEDWLEVSVSEIADFVNGGAFTRDASGAGRMVIRIAELNNGPGPSTVYNEIDVSVEKTAHAGDILMAWSGSLGVHYWTRPEAIINQHIFKVVCKKYPSWLVFDRLLRVMPELKQTAADKATTMGHIKRHHLYDTKVTMPKSETLRILDMQLAPIWDRLMSAEIENHSLQTLRGALLPELMSGRLRIKDAESFVDCV